MGDTFTLSIKMEETSDDTNRILNDIRTYLRITALAAARQTAMRVLDSYEKAIVYSKMDGKTSSYKIADATAVPQRTVADWADEFVKSSLASPPNEFYQSHKALFSLSELFIDLTTLKRRRKPDQMQRPSPSPIVKETIVNSGEQA